MNQEPHLEIPKPPRVPRLPESIRPDIAQAAKWPPDDDGLPGSMGGSSFSGGGYGGGDDGNFKKGRFKPIAIILAFLAVGAGLAIFLIGGTKQAEQLSAKQIADEKKAVSVLPIAEAIPMWRKWSAMNRCPRARPLPISRPSPKPCTTPIRAVCCIAT